jgi:hypothetical protein
MFPNIWIAHEKNSQNQQSPGAQMSKFVKWVAKYYAKSGTYTKIESIPFQSSSNRGEHIGKFYPTWNPGTISVNKRGGIRYVKK